MNHASEIKDEIRAVVTGVVHDTDAKRWDTLRAHFAPEVTSDYTSLFGGTPQTQPAAALVGTWRGVLARVATQHLLGPIQVEVTATGANAECHVRALHYAKGAPGGEYWEVLGHYVFELVRSGNAFHIRKMTLETQVQTGNQNLLAEAGAAK